MLGVMNSISPPGGARNLVVRDLEIADYAGTYAAMRAFTDRRGPDTPDELWVLEHPPTYTLGYAGDPSGLLRESDVPLVRTDRGGQITYHGPGQAVAYLLADLRRGKRGPRAVVSCLEGAAIDLLAARGIEGKADPARPGVYVGGKKIASVGLRVRRGCCYHGLSLNVDMDLAPFADIRPCGHEGLEVCQMRDFPGAAMRMAVARSTLAAAVCARLGGPGRGAILAPLEES